MSKRMYQKPETETLQLAEKESLLAGSGKKIPEVEIDDSEDNTINSGFVDAKPNQGLWDEEEEDSTWK